MALLANFRIGRRLALGFLTIVGLSVAIAALSIWRLQLIAAEARELMAAPLTKERLVSDLAANVSGGIRRTLAIVKSSDPALAEYFAADAAANTKSGNQIQSRLSELLASGDERRVFDTLKQARGRFIKVRDAIMREKKAGHAQQVDALFSAEFEPAVKNYQSALSGMLRQQRERMDAIGLDIGAVTRQSSLFVGALSALVVLLGIAISWLLTRSVTEPVARALKAVNTVAAGDLSGDIRSDSRDEIGELLAALSRMNASLASIVGQVRHSASLIGAAAADIASGNRDLSVRTEQQAAMVEETASSSEQLAASVQQNVDHAEHARRLATAASDVAADGGSKVGQVAQTMDAILLSSARVVDIIAVIDGLAFQTNILALNAAVEAANAGEAGRGFAVVAGEVRNLAQKSAAAAKTIRHLIAESSRQVALGTELVRQASATMRGVVDSAAQVMGVMGDIALVAREQNAGIQQFSGTVVEIDRMTQQNSSLSEQAFALAASLQEQAASLAAEVAKFRLRQQ